MRASATLPILPLALSCLLGGCQTESVHKELGEVRPATVQQTLVGRARIEERIPAATEGSAPTMALRGTIRTYEFDDGSGRRIHRVFDVRDQPVGYVTDRGVAFRHTAHGGTEMVANSTDLRRNVAAVLGASGAPFEVVEEAGL